MASFSAAYPVAYHVLPLHFLKGVFRAGVLFAKRDLPAGHSPRPTTCAVDLELGFAGFVHFYLGQPDGSLTDLPILEAQHRPSRVPPVPHAVLELPTDTLSDDACTICNWNIAVSRPSVEGVAKGGNWTRGTSPRRIREVWDAFRRTRPSASRARGLWHDDVAIPVLRGREIADHVSLLRAAPGGRPELLLESPVSISDAWRLIVFSEADARSLHLLGRPPADIPVEVRAFPGYDDESVPTPLRSTLEAFFLSDDDWPPDIPFDRVRPSLMPRRRSRVLQFTVEGFAPPKKDDANSV